MNLDLYNSKKYITDIIAKGKEKIENEMDLKDSEYFISNYDLNSNNISYVHTLEDATQIATKFDNNEYINKDFAILSLNLKKIIQVYANIWIKLKKSNSHLMMML